MQFLCKTALPVVLVAAGCATSSNSNTSANIPEAHPRVVLARVTKNGWNAKEARQASSLYALKCGRCHKFYDPAPYAEADWQTWMRKMSRKAKLKPEQEQLLSSYLDAARK